MSVSHSLTQPLRDRAGSVAHRLLAGGGLAAVVAYRIDPEASVEVLAHGLTETGELVVALRGGTLPEGYVHDVRMDVRREATEATVRITSASAHLLGRLAWLTHDEVALLGSDAGLPTAAAMLVGAPGVRWARVSSERVLLHDASGVTPFAWGDATAGRESFPDPSAELHVHDVVLAAAGDDLATVCRAVVDQALPGRVQSDRPSPQGVCDHTADRVFCVDVDGLGVHLMHVGRERTTVVFAPFVDKVADLDALAVQVRALVARARRAYA